MKATFRFPLESMNVSALSTSSAASPPLANTSCWALHAAARSFSRFARLFSSFSDSPSAGRPDVGVANGTERNRTDSILADGVKVRRWDRSWFNADYKL